MAYNYELCVIFLRVEGLFSARISIFDFQFIFLEKAAVNIHNLSKL